LPLVGSSAASDLVKTSKSMHIKTSCGRQLVVYHHPNAYVLMILHFICV